MPDPTRPVSISAVSTGPSSLIIDALTSRPTTGAAAELIERQPALQRQRRAGEEAGQQHDGQRSDADHVELLDDVVAVERAGEDADHGAADEVHVLLHLERRVLRSSFR